ncbi:PDZK1-interacting protein 1 [Nelusetta ayraudi]|uniref:PDZK1-interacting protein 1 n=1 Tax=Nelusetta ayraudi TaxID=303726 RepID=UPI003F70D61A
MERSLPQWLTGIIAVSAFLFLVFVSLLVNRLWCSSDRGRSQAVGGAKWSSSRLGSVRSVDKNAYENAVMDEEKVTAM